MGALNEAKVYAQTFIVHIHVHRHTRFFTTTNLNFASNRTLMGSILQIKSANQQVNNHYNLHAHGNMFNLQ